MNAIAGDGKFAIRANFAMREQPPALPVHLRPDVGSVNLFIFFPRRLITRENCMVSIARCFVVMVVGFVMARLA